MKKPNKAFSMTIFFSATILVLSGCSEKLPMQGESGGAFIISTPTLGSDGEPDNGNNPGNNPGNGSPSTQLSSPSNVTATPVDGNPLFSSPATAHKYIRLTWSNPDPTATTIVEAKLVGELNYTRVVTLAGNVLTYNYDLGILGTDRAYAFQLKNTKGSSESAFTLPVQANVLKSQLVAPSPFEVTYDPYNFDNGFAYNWGYPTYVPGQHTGFVIEYYIYFKNSTSSVGSYPIPNPSALSASFDPCSGLSDRSQVAEVGSRIYATAAGGVNASEPSSYRSVVGCPTFGR